MPRRKKEEYLYGKGPVKAASIRIARNAIRTKKQAIRLKSYGLPDPTIAADLEAAHQLMQRAVSKLDKVPKGWRPVRGTLGSRPIEAGMTVKVKATVIDRYEGVFDVKSDLYVAEIKGTRLICETLYRGAKVRVAMPRSHVQPSGKE
jgi:hypothetical protein